MKESELALELIKYLENYGYESYKEVCMKGRGGNARADIYFVKKSKGVVVDTIVVEAKTSLTLKVIEQADRWKSAKMSMRTFVLVPATKRKDWKSRKFALKICENLGIGVFQLFSDGIRESVVSDILDTVKMPPLYNDQKDSVAGNDRSEYMTDFKRTVNTFYDFMKNKEEYIWKDLIVEINHHYKSDKVAIATLKKYINGVGRFDLIQGYRFEKRGKDNYIIKD